MGLGGVAEYGRSGADSFQINTIKIAILTTGLVKQLAFFVVILMPQEGAAWGVGFEIHGWR